MTLLAVAGVLLGRWFSRLPKGGWIVGDSFMLDHCVTVLEVTDAQVVIGDPLNGKASFTYEELERGWRFVGAALRRKSELSTGFTPFSFPKFFVLAPGFRMLRA